MNLNIFITEQDVFNYVFFRGKLSDEKVNRIESESSLKDIIKFYKELKKGLMEGLSSDIKKKISSKIPSYKESNVIYLYPVKEESKKRRNDIVILAADSPVEKPEVTAITFIDEDKDYLIRLLKLKDSSKIYIFSTTEELLKNFTLTIQPGNFKIDAADNSSPIEIDEIKEPESVTLEFN